MSIQQGVHARGLKTALLTGVAAFLMTTGYAAAQDAVVKGRSEAMAEPATQVAQAQVAQATGAAAAKDDLKVEEIVITGSRLRRTQFDVLQPTVEVNIGYIDRRGFTNIADALNDVPGFGTAVSPIGDQSTFNVGQNFVNLFSLGSARTLTLVNGRRFVAGRAPSLFGDAGPGLQVDMNVIPTAFIERIDRIAVGGAPIYGADAIAGTVNVILRDDYEGGEVDLLFGNSDEDDAKNKRVRAAYGVNFDNDRGNIALAVEYNDTQGLLYTDRKRTAKDITFVPNPADTGAADGIPGQLYREGRTIPLVTAGGIPLTVNSGGGSAAAITSRFFRIPDPNNPGQTVPAQFVDGRLVPFNPGQIFSGSIAIGGDGLRLSSVTSLQAPVERKLGAIMGHYDILDNLRFFVEGNYSKTIGYENVNQPVYNSPLFSGEGTGLTMRTDNAFLSPADRAVLSAGGRTTFVLSRGHLDLVDGNENRSENELKRIVTGFSGDFDVADRAVNWSLSYNYGKTEGEFTTTQVLDATFPLAIDAVRDPATGQIVCRSRAAGCVPLNIFGNGSPSPEAIAYVTGRDVSRSAITQEVVEFNADTSVVTLPAGDLQVGVGALWRKEKGDFKPGEITVAGAGRTVAISPVSGDYTSKEVYGEVLVPLLDDSMGIPLVYRLEAEGSIRYVDNSLAGGDDTWTIGGRYSPIRDITFRGNWTESIRSPAITELFLPKSDLFTTATDPCATRNVSGGPNPAVRQANCRAALEALGRNPNAPFVSRIETATIQGETAGNPSLTNEQAKSWSVGVVVNPRFLEDLTIAVDWVDIEISDAITNLSASALLQVCYDNPGYPSAACDRFVRTPRSAGLVNEDDIGQITFIRTGYVNAGYTNFSGLTATVNYDFDFGDYGQLALGGSYYYIHQLETSVTGLGFDLGSDAGEVGQSKHQFQIQADYTYDKVGLLVQANYLSSAKFNNDFTVESRDILEIDDYWRFDTTATYMLADNVEVRLAINNLFDVEPPKYSTGVGVYDLIGRYYSVGLNAKF